MEPNCQRTSLQKLVLNNDVSYHHVYLPFIDWLMKETTEEKSERNGITWTLTNVLGDIDQADI